MLQQAAQLERTLAYHCAPSLAGVKPADLISWREDGPTDRALLGRYAGLLSQQGVCLRVLRRSEGRSLLLIYRPTLLRDCLAQPAVSAMLAAAGYPSGMEGQLAHLSRRLEGEKFPHEIGLFLGYPPEDVAGFQRHGGRNCKLVGQWKVYGQVEEAARRFQLFRRCREELCRGMEAGNTLLQLLPAG